MNFQDKDVYIDDNINELVKEIDRETNNISTEVSKPQMNEDSK